MGIDLPGSPKDGLTTKLVRRSAPSSLLPTAKATPVNEPNNNDQQEVESKIIVSLTR
jgi:hypothetical protein